MVVCLAVAAGCAPRLRGIPVGEQVAFDKDEGLFEHREGLTIAAMGLGRPPISAGHEFVAMAIELQNHGQASFAVELERVRLGMLSGDRWLERQPSRPDDLLQAYQSADASPATRVREVTGAELVRHRAYDHGYAYPYGSYHSVHFYSAYSDGAREAYEMQQRTSSFLARLLRSQPIAPGEVLSGFIVFPQPIEKKDRLRLRVPIEVVEPAAPSGTTSAPAAPTSGETMMFEFHFEVH